MIAADKLISFLDSQDEVAIQMYNTDGTCDGVIVKTVSDFFRIEYDSKYNQKMEKLIETDTFEIVAYDGKLVTTTMFDFSTESITGSGTKDSFIIRDSSTHYALKFTTADTSADPWAVFQSLNDGSAGQKDPAAALDAGHL
jgi:ATP-dependent phosphoenolpyruvate carboxykinase